jgi:hypothetical protein
VVRKVLAVAVALAGVALGAWLLWPKPPDDDEALIRKAVAEIAAAAAKKDIGGVAEHVSERYHGEGGSKTELKRYLLGYTMRSDWVSAVVAKLEIGPIEGGKAKADMVVLLARKPAESADELRSEEIAGSHQIDVDFEKEDGTWRVVSAARRGATASDFIP